MYRNLCPDALGITGRQSELIELALTYGFNGIDLDVGHFRKQVEMRGLEHAARFLKSSRLRIGPFELPVRWDADEQAVKEDLAQLRALLQPASEIGVDTCYTTIQPASDSLPYHENFEFCRQRLAQVGEVLAEYNVRLGLTFLASPIHRAGREFQFISSPDALLTLMKTTVVSNLALLIDLWQWRVGGGTLDQLRELSPDQIVMVRLADIPDDEAMDAIADEKRLMPGATGVVDNAGALRVLNEIGYDGPVAAYPHPSQLKGQTRDRLVQRTADALDSLWKEAELEAPVSRLAPVSG